MRFYSYLITTYVIGPFATATMHTDDTHNSLGSFIVLHHQCRQDLLHSFVASHSGYLRMCLLHEFREDVPSVLERVGLLRHVRDGVRFWFGRGGTLAEDVCKLVCQWN